MYQSNSKFSETATTITINSRKIYRNRFHFFLKPKDLGLLILFLFAIGDYVTFAQPKLEGTSVSHYENFKSSTLPQSLSTCTAIDLPYFETFNEIDPCTTFESPEGQDGWTLEHFNQGFDYNHLEFTNTNTSQGNAWFFTRGVNLQVGIVYNVSYRYGNDGYDGWGAPLTIEKLRVKIGTQPTGSAMTTMIADHPNVITSPNINSVNFSVTQTGVYYLGFNAYTYMNYGLLALDNINIIFGPDNCIPKTWYADADGDGLGNPNISIQNCNFQQGYVLNSTDCDDNDASVWRLGYFYYDGDGDGYDHGYNQICYGINPPPIYSETTLGTDCDDMDPEAHSYVVLYFDMDGDGYHSAISSICYGGWVPDEHSLTTLGFDCDDYNAAVNPGATEIAGNGIDDNCNGNIDEATAIPAIKECGTTINIYSAISARVVSGATGYKFKITNLTNPNGTNGVMEIQRPVSWFHLTSLPSYEYNTTYRIQVATKTSGEYTAYLPACDISTLPYSALNLSIRQCGATYTNRYASINAFVIPNVSGYRFRITHLATSVQQQISSPISWITLNQITAYVPGASYSVEVAVKTTGDFGAYGAACTINTPAAITNGTIANTANFKVIASPNPFSNTFSLEITTESLTNPEIKIYDMIGKLLEVQSVQSSELSSQQLGRQLPSGVYTVLVSQDDMVKTLKVIKR